MSKTKRVRKRPIEVEAWQWDPKDVTDLDPKDWPKWLRDVEPAFNLGLQLIIPTLEGPVTASKGDWIIRGVKGEVYPCKPDVFEATYDEV
jgi:hypothetical protein